MVQKNKSGRKLMAYLFNDILLLTQPKSSGTKPFGLYRKPLLLTELSVREATRVPNKDIGVLDNCCFQLLFEDEILTLRTNNVSEKRQWINQVETARKMNQPSKPKSNQLLSSQSEAIGTLNVVLIRARKSASSGMQALILAPCREIFAVANVGEQKLKSKIIDGNALVFNQSLIFKLQSLDAVLQISVFKYDKYSADGNADL
jgi:hypothetical protein